MVTFFSLALLFLQIKHQLFSVKFMKFRTGLIQFKLNKPSKFLLEQKRSQPVSEKDQIACFSTQGNILKCLSQIKKNKFSQI